MTIDRSFYPFTFGLPREAVLRLLSARFTQADYRLYLRTEHWQAKKAEAFKVHGYTCATCRNPATQVHHKWYGCLFREDARTDLAVLCSVCHKKLSK